VSAKSGPKIDKKGMEKVKKDWVVLLNELGFDKVRFPIIIKDGQDLSVVQTLDDFAGDPDRYAFPNENYRMESLIDSDGTEWTWKYDYENGTNLPGTVKWIRDAGEIKKMIRTYFRGGKSQLKIEESIEIVSNIADLINIIDMNS
jgi:hypothetical protein